MKKSKGKSVNYWQRKLFTNNIWAQVIFPLPCDLLDSGAQAAAGKDVPTLKTRETVDIELEAWTSKASSQNIVS